MRLRRTKAALLTVGLAAAMVACGEAGEDDAESENPEQEVEQEVQFPEGSQMAEFAEAGTIRIGTKFDQPGLGFKEAGEDTPVGFDVEIGEIIAGKLGIDAGDIEWVETISDNREPFLQQDKVDLVIASYSITPERRAVVGQMGPYYATGQQLLVAADSDIDSVEDVKGKEVCSVTGSTSLEQIEEAGAIGRGFDTYSECAEQVLNGQVEAATTDGAILLGYAAQRPDDLKVVGEEFSEELYGIGYFPKDDTDFCNFLRDTIMESYEDGSWEAAFEATLGKSGIETPEPPTPDECT